MGFSYYKNLSPKQKKIVAQSDAVSQLPITHAEHFFKRALAIEKVLETGQRKKVEELTQIFANDFCLMMKVPNLFIKVLARRPHDEASELHGLYEREHTGKSQIKLWMKTAKKGQTVKFKTFFRTLIHELMHHLDYTHLMLADSFHTKGFYQRESFVFKTILEAPFKRPLPPTPKKQIEIALPPSQLSLKLH